VTNRALFSGLAIFAVLIAIMFYSGLFMHGD
jgi:hypothetical protein